MLQQNREGRLLRLTLDRPEKRNALNAAMLVELRGAVRGAMEDAGIGAILIDANGPVFCAGMDLNEAVDPDAPPLEELHAELFTLKRTMKKPLIAAVQGPAMGGGFGLVANAHIAIAAEEARFGLTELRIGMWPFFIWGAVVDAVGERRALELTLTARLFDAGDALAWGLVHSVVPASELAERALALAREIANASPETIARGFEVTAHPERAVSLRAEQFASADFREGVRAFLEKRAPRWPSLPGER